VAEPVSERAAERPIGRGVSIALSRQAHDRIADRRVDEDWFAQVWRDPATRVLVLAGTRFRLVDGRVTWVSPQEAPEGVPVLLGDREGVVHFAVVADKTLADDTWTGLRGILADVDDDEAALVVHAVGIAEWLFATRHCVRCGGALEPRQLGHVLRQDAAHRLQVGPSGEQAIDLPPGRRQVAQVARLSFHDVEIVEAADDFERLLQRAGGVHLPELVG